MTNIINKIKKINNLKLKLNITIISTILLIILFLAFKGDTYLSHILLENNNNIVGINIKDPFIIDEENNKKIEKLSYNNKVADLSNWKWPTTSNYAITSYYSYSHNAIDIYSYDGYGSPIYAANNGEVITVSNTCIAGNLYCNGKRGNYIVINHNKNNYYTVYMHLSEISVKVGDIVEKGSVIGKMGNTGNVIPVPSSYNPYAGTHLHFNVYIGEPYKGGYTINPLNLY